MKVICKCCHKAFDYDMYMGLCPKCGRVYRRGKGHYSVVEKDMLGDFHVHVDEGGLNRGIHGVVYNQGTVSEKQILNSTSKATVNKEIDAGPANVAASSPVTATSSNQVMTREQFKAAYMSGGSPQAINAIKTQASAGNQYYSANHGTRMNQGVNNSKNSGAGIAFLIIVLFMIFGFLMEYFG